MEKAMAPHSSTLAWKIPWREERGRLQSMGLLGVGHDSNFTFSFHFHALEKEMATDSSVLAWRISGTGESGGLPSLGSHRVGHDWRDLAAAAACLLCGRPGFDPWVGKIPWRRKWQPTPVFLPGESHGWRSLLGYSPWGRKVLDTTEQLHFTYAVIKTKCNGGL